MIRVTSWKRPARQTGQTRHRTGERTVDVVLNPANALVNDHRWRLGMQLHRCYGLVAWLAVVIPVVLDARADVRNGAGHLCGAQKGRWARQETVDLLLLRRQT